MKKAKKAKTAAPAKKVVHHKHADPMDSTVIKFGAAFVIVAGFLLLAYVVKFYT